MAWVDLPPGLPKPGCPDAVGRLDWLPILAL